MEGVSHDYPGAVSASMFGIRGPWARNRVTPSGFDGPHLRTHRHIHWHLTARHP